MIAFTVLGQPQTAGSKRAFPFHKRDGRLGVKIADDNPRSRDWKQQVAWSARNAHRGELLDGPLVARFTFYRPRPKTHFKRDGSLSAAGLREPAPATRPDSLKLRRAAEDALIGVIYRDDSQIVDGRDAKVWGEPARMEVRIGSFVDSTIDAVEKLPRETVGAA